MNINQQTMFTRDNLPVMRGMDSESVDLIYLDPPFNSKKQWSAPIGSKAAGAAFKDSWTLSDIDKADLGILAEERPQLAKLIDAIGDVNGDADKSYLLMMAPRLIEMQRILKPTGSIYLHCDPVMSHSLKLVMDTIFGSQNFRNEIIWSYQGTGEPKRHFKRKHDVILFYAQSKNCYFSDKGSSESISDFSKSKFTKVDEKGRFKEIKHPDGSIHRQYMRDKQRMRDVWEIPIINAMARERTGYPTQKPLRLLNRIIEASSNPGDFVLDPFCGCATACVAAQDLNRKWIGIDISEKAVALVLRRFKDELQILVPKIIHRDDIPIRSDGIVSSKNIKHIRYGEQEGYCVGCKHHFPFHGLTIDHIVPQSQGGTDDDSNIQLLCSSCNSTKGNRSMGHLKAALQEKGIGQ